ncbi:MAG: hypothetical protein ACRBCI_02810 [Cellvibrionaceae bacterium]
MGVKEILTLFAFINKNFIKESMQSDRVCYKVRGVFGGDMKNILFALSFTFFSCFASADFTDCKNLYVGSLTATDGSFLVVLKSGKNDSAGSYAVSFNGWSDKDRVQATSLLLAAKISGHRVNVGTNGSNACAITEGGKVFSHVQLANNP